MTWAWPMWRAGGLVPTPRIPSIFSGSGPDPQQARRSLPSGRPARPAPVDVADDTNIRALLEAETLAYALSERPGTSTCDTALQTTLEENLNMIRDSIAT